MARQATKAVGNRYFEARIKAAKYNEKLLTRIGAADSLPGVTEDEIFWEHIDREVIDYLGFPFERDYTDNGRVVSESDLLKKRRSD